MPKYQAKLKGEFEIIEQVVADTKEQAEEMLKANEGNELSVVAVGDIELEDFEQVEE